MTHNNGLNKTSAAAFVGRGVGIVVNTEKYYLQSLVSEKAGQDTLAHFLQGVHDKGLSGKSDKAPGHGGLVQIIDEWLITEDKHRPTAEYIRDHVQDIMDFGTNYTT